MTKNINEVMLSIPIEWRYYWCESKVCCCLGCVNRAGGIERKGFTKEDWLKWVENNPKSENINDIIKYSNKIQPPFNMNLKLP